MLVLEGIKKNNMTLTINIQQEIDSKFLGIGGYQLVQEYLSEPDLIDSVLFGGQTIFLSSFSTTDSQPTIVENLTDYGYQPDSLLAVLNPKFELLAQKVLEPTVIAGQAIYQYGLTEDERLLLFKKHLARFFFSFETTQGVKVIQVFALTEIPPSEQRALLNLWRAQAESLLREQTSIDELFIKPITQSQVSLFISEFQTTTFLSPVNEQVFLKGDSIYISSSTSIVIAFKKVLKQLYNQYLELTENALTAALLLEDYTLIYQDTVDNSQYWLSSGGNTRLDIHFNAGLVSKVNKLEFTKLELSNPEGTGLSRLKYRNGIYTLKAASRFDPLQPSRTIKLSITAGLSE
jgi:hypothetical protein